MKVLRKRKYLFALFALLVVFAACKGESPTAPTPGGGTGNGGSGGGGGGVTPPTGASITLTVSNATPLVSSTSIVTATVSQNGNPVPNGTAVEFTTTVGQWTDTGLSTTIRTTTNGVATATLTSATPGAATVTAIVNNVLTRTTITFSQTTTIPPPDTAAAITTVSPGFGRPAGGETLTITGKNFRTPIRVLFDFGSGDVREGFVVPGSVSSTSLQVVTPQITLTSGQTRDATIVLLNEAGTPAEQRVTGPGPFTYRLAQLTPIVSAVSPDQGPITGGTRITIFGEGFESPVQVSFAPGASAGSAGWSAMQVISVTYNQIIAITPAARDINPTGSGTLTGPADLRIRNINSNTEVIAPVIFRYTPAMQITGVRPLIGSSLGGTDVTIDGIGFDPPVDVFIGGVLAQTIRVSGSQILARTGALASPCANASGPITVTNINNGDTDSSTASFTYVGVNPIITSVSGAPFTPGSTVTTIVQDPGIGPLGNAIVRFGIGGANVSPAPNQITAGTGPQTFTFVVPTTGFTFPTVACTTPSLTPGTQLGPVTQNLTFTNSTTSCTSVLENGITVTPPGANPCLAPPTASVSPVAGTCSAAPASVAVGPATSNTTPITVSNAANSRDLVITNPTVTCVNATCTITPGALNSPGTTTVTAGNSVNFTVTVDPTAAGPVSGTVSLPTNDPTKPTVTVCITGSGT